MGVVLNKWRIVRKIKLQKWLKSQYLWGMCDFEVSKFMQGWEREQLMLQSANTIH
jgi:hypothetical protein